LIWLLLLAVFASAAGPGAARAPVSVTPSLEQPLLRIAAKARGQAAVSALGAHLGEVAARYGNPSPFSNEERDRIQGIWQGVAIEPLLGPFMCGSLNRAAGLFGPARH
jgi:hypothetical protein